MIGIGSAVMAAIMFIILFSACKKVEYKKEISNSSINLKSMSAGSSVVGDTLNVEIKRKTILKISTQNTATVIQVVFHDDNSTVNAVDGLVAHTWLDAQITSLTIKAIYPDQSYEEKSFIVNALIIFGEPVRFISVVPIGGGGNFFAVQLAVNKNSMPEISGAYFYLGSGDIGGWDDSTNVNAYNSSMRLDNNILYPVANNLGEWIKIDLILSPNDYEMGIGKGGVWASWDGSKYVEATNPTKLLFKLNNEGIITSNASGLLLPGAIGDGYVRFDITETELIVYTNNGNGSSPFPFQSYMLSTGLWGAPSLQLVLPDFPGWGKIILQRLGLPEINKMKYGPDGYNPNIINPDMINSEFYDSRFEYLSFSINSLSVSK